MLTKLLKKGENVFVTSTGFRNEIIFIGLREIEKVGKKYFHVSIYGNVELFCFDGTKKDSRYELWDSEKSYEAITEKRKERREKIKQIEKLFEVHSRNLQDEALDEILQLLTPQVH